MIKRLLGYVKPYWHLFLIYLIFLIGITALELLNPYLFKIAIDDHITIKNRIIYEVEDDSLDNLIMTDGSLYLLPESFERQKDRINNYGKSKIIKDLLYRYRR